MSPDKKLPLGEWGELTESTITEADLTPAERDRAREMLKVQAAYLQILECLSFPVDPDGHVHDLNMMGPTRIAIAWTLALAGFRMTGSPYIKKRFFEAPGCYKGAHTWVDIREPDTAEEALRPEHSAADPALPPDTRRLAAIRDGEVAAPRNVWQTAPKISTAAPGGVQ